MNMNLMPTASELSNGNSPIVKCSNVWTIHNFSFYCSDRKEIRSAIFSKDGIEWYYNLVFRMDIKHIVVNFNLVTNTIKPERSARCQLSILHGIDKKYGYGAFDNTNMKYFNWFMFPIETLLEKPNEWLLNDQLRIYSEISVCDLSYKKGMNDVEVPCCRVLDDYRLLFDNEKFSDLILSAAGKEFKAHKIILCARSTVFQAMFEHKMKEHKSNRVDISDINPEVLQELLRFIYTGEVMNIEKIASDLLFAADKYALDRLKAICEKELCSKLSIGNVLQLLMLADRHNATQLKAKAICFFKMHATQVMEIPESEEMVLLPFLMKDLLRS